MENRILIVHETGGQKYFEAIDLLSRAGEIAELDYFEFQVTRLFLSSVLRRRESVKAAAKQALRNIRFRLRVPFVHDHTIVFAMAPWDIRLVWYRCLAARNAVIYHTSWTQWEAHKVPRRYGLLNPVLQNIWKGFLRHPNVSIVAVTPASAAAVGTHTDKEIWVIPHIVSKEFFIPRSRPARKSFGLLFVGQLIPQKGISLLPAVLNRCGPGTTLGIIGGGPMYSEVAEMVRQNENIQYHGQVNARGELAEIVSRYDVLLVPSLRTARWEELFGMVIPEAMAAGLVVIASNHVGPRAILTDGKDGFLVEERSIDKVVELVTVLHKEASVLHNISESARHTASTYSFEMVGRKWLQLLSGTKSAYDKKFRS